MTSRQVEDLPSRRRRSMPAAVVDALLLVVIVAVPVIAVLAGPPDGPGWETEPVLISATISIPLILLRRRSPLLLAALAVVATVAVMGITDDQQPVTLVQTTFVLLYTVATLTDRRTAWSAGLAAAATLYGAQLVAFDASLVHAPGIATVAWLGLAVAAGDAVRSRRSFMDAMEDRARRREEIREEETRRRVAEERLRIARELHDVVAHRMTVISVQSSAAASQLRRDPDGAEASLEIVRSSAATVLDELGGVLRVLRSVDDGVAVEPTPSLADVDDLVGTFADAGLEVHRELSGLPRPLSEATQLAAFRVIQEALTNAQKHGRGRADLSLAYSGETLQITVENPTDPPASVAGGATSGAGLGLIGMRERVAAAGGTLKASTVRPGLFRVVAGLPAIPEGGR